MREALPDQTALLDEIIAQNSAIIGKLNGIIQSGVTIGTVERQQKLARSVNEIQLAETSLLSLYEELIGEL